MKLFVCVFSEARLLPHLFRHYSRFGVTDFHVAVPPHLEGYASASASAGGYAVTLYRDFDVRETVTGGTEAVNGMREAVQAEREWVVIVDLDEFVEFDGPIADLLRRANAEDANVVRGIMYDRFALDGQPKVVDEDSDLERRFPVRARFVKEVMGGVDVKGVLVKGRLRAAGAHHYFEGERIYSQTLDISHYKWTDSALERVQIAIDMTAAEGISWSSQYELIRDHYERYGRFAWETFGGEVVGSRD
jgi:hypothetical protein